MEWTCCRCGYQEESTIEDEQQAVAELEENFGAEWSVGDCDILCDDCYDAFMEWFEAESN